MIDIELIEDEGNDLIYSYLLENDKTLIYSSPRFIGLISKHLQAKPFWIIGKRNNKIIGLLPYLVKDGILGPAFNSMPYFGSNGGIVINNSDFSIKLALLRFFFQKAKEENACAATIITNPLLKDYSFYKENCIHDYLDKRIGQITHLGGINSPEDLMKIFSNPRPRNIRKAIKEGVVVRKSQEYDDLNFLYETHKKNILSINGMPKDKDFFLEIDSKMKSSDWMIFIAELKGKRIAALLLFYFNQTIEYFTPAVVEEYRRYQPMALIVFKAMSEALELDIKNWNWGGTWLSQGGVYDFKKKWGTTDYEYYYFNKIYNKDILACTSFELLKRYKGFYIIPFNKLTDTI